MSDSVAEVFENEENKRVVPQRNIDFLWAKDLSQATINKEYIIKDIDSDDEDLKSFLFTLGCFIGESISVISVLAENFVIVVKDARYSIDADLAKAIMV